MNYYFSYMHVKCIVVLDQTLCMRGSGSETKCVTETSHCDSILFCMFHWEEPKQTLYVLTTATCFLIYMCTGSRGYHQAWTLGCSLCSWVGV